MPRFRYTAIDPRGQRVSRTAEAAGLDALVAQLAAEGLKIEQVHEVSPVAEAPEPAQPAAGTPQDYVELTERIGQLATANLPLGEGLQVLAEEAASPRLRTILKSVGRDLERGVPLEETLAERRHNLPPHLVEILRAGVASGRLGIALNAYLQSYRHGQDVRRKLLLGIAYSLLLCGTAVLLVGVCLVTIVPQFAEIFTDFDTELPGLTFAVVELSRILVNAQGAILGVGMVLLAIIYTTWYTRTGRELRLRLTFALPGIGRLYRLSSLSEFAHLLALLLESEVPLPRAFQLAGNAVQDPQLAISCRRIAERVTAGDEPSAIVGTIPGMPHGLAQLLRWSDRPRALPELLRAAAEMFESRARMQASSFGPVLEPVIVVGVGVAFGGIVLALFLPLLKLLNDLS